jgi:hypothetical protein
MGRGRVIFDSKATNIDIFQTTISHRQMIMQVRPSKRESELCGNKKKI